MASKVLLELLDKIFNERL